MMPLPLTCQEKFELKTFAVSDRGAHRIDDCEATGDRNERQQAFTVVRCTVFSRSTAQTQTPLPVPSPNEKGGGLGTAARSPVELGYLSIMLLQYSNVIPACRRPSYQERGRLLGNRGRFRKVDGQNLPMAFCNLGRRNMTSTAEDRQEDDEDISHPFLT
ncbi:unnamed protein product [Soboliphyme baturini]|uniref:Uncharacterized protein n=1 Tax=Soboliphyme baturini TaxID=241478 RepID=A0A183IGZ5_9BILA|nr:unnamed protein product [Soboliphyme baturini]